MDAHPIPFRTLAIVLCIHVSKLYGWYNYILSDYSAQQAAGTLHRHDIKSQGKTVRVPIVKAEHIGREMAIDEKHIDGEFYTVLTNKDSGKLALLAQTLRNKDIGRILRPFADKRFGVKVLTRDLANSYDWVGCTCFPNAMHVAGICYTSFLHSGRGTKKPGPGSCLPTTRASNKPIG